MKNNMIVSVIIPVFDTPPSIFKRCYDSLLNQTYLNTQIIVIDDGSNKENSQKYKEILDRNTVYKRQVNSGVSIARNNGVIMATGSYVTFVDSDDELEPSFINECIDEIVSANLDVLITGKKIIRNKEIIDVWQPNLVVARKNKAAYEEIAINNYLYVASGSFIRTDIAKAISFEKTMYLGEDTLYLIDALKKANNIGISDCSGYRYDKGNSTLSKGDNVEEILKYIDNNYCFINKLKETIYIDNAIKDAIISIKIYEALSMLCDYKTNYSQFKKVIRKSNIHPVSRHSLKSSTYSPLKKLLILLISRRLYFVSYVCLRLKANIKKIIGR